ncbi:metalloprotease PmbA [Caulobacter radicis]|uniref:TldD/PmbA family protein n=1 Tax=Caulobacter radicis TaxID=2172650 RepID=UPI000D563E61|nr:metallopeptidase TldD-related protein [Caulobacter radicis]PVM84524.1 metalloprotease PmbA [Caulobacter radicis]
MSAISPQRQTESAPSSQSEDYLLQSEADLTRAVSYAIDRSGKLGAGEALAMVHETGGINITVTNGAVEKAIRDGGQTLRITIYENGRTGTASTEALSTDAIDRAVEQALSMARQLEPDEDAGLADRADLAWDTPAVPMFAPSNHSAADLVAAALELEAGALQTANKDRVRVTDAGAASQDQRFAMATSQGFCRTGSASIQQRWCQTIAERGGEMKQSSWMSVDRRLEGLESSASVGRRAAERALESLGASELSTRKAPVLVDATVASSLVREMCGQLMGSAQFRRMTFLPDALGQAICAEHLSVVEDPFEPFGLASTTFDNEGVAGARRDIVRQGLVAGLFLDTRMARKLSMVSTGNAGGNRNLTLASTRTEPGDHLGAMLRKLGTGLWLTRFMGGGVNPVTGAYSRAAAGFWVENGVVTGPVQGFTVAGNLQEMLKSISAVGADVHREGAVRTGSILLPDMQIAGR